MKSINMKSMALMSFIFLSFILQNCDLNRIQIHRIYRIENGTQREITMKFYSYGIFSWTHHIIGEGLIYEGTASNRGGQVDTAASGALLGADSVVVIFDNSKTKIYTKISRGERGLKIAPLNRNFLLNDAYEIINNELYRFVFTEQDYENAADCDGNCETLSIEYREP